MRILEDTDYDLWILLSRVYHLIAMLRKLELADYEILPVQSYILFIIKALGNETTPTEISEHVYQQKSSISDILNRMVKKGLIRKENKPGGKKRVIVSLTDKGEEALKFSKNGKYLYKVMSSIDDQKKRQLEIVLEILRDSAITQVDVKEKAFLRPSKISKFYSKK